MKIITKEEFIAAYNKYAPKSWVVFAFKYFSRETAAKNMKLSTSIAWILLTLFVVGFIGTVIDLPEIVVGIATAGFGGLLAIIVLFLLAAVLFNNKRIKKIAKDLDIPLSMYNELVNKWGDELK